MKTSKVVDLTVVYHLIAKDLASISTNLATRRIAVLQQAADRVVKAVVNECCSDEVTKLLLKLQSYC